MIGIGNFSMKILVSYNLLSTIPTISVVMISITSYPNLLEIGT